MARTQKAPSVRSVKTRADRDRPSVFIRLKAEEQFKGHALFEPFPGTEGEKKMKDKGFSGNPGFFEYLDHYDQQANRYVPCAGETCPFCRVNNNPSTRAMTAWYFPDNPVDQRVKVFTMNYGTTQDITDASEEDDGILGVKFRIKRKDDRGNYIVRPLTDKALTKKEIKELLKGIPDLEDIVNSQLKKEWQRLQAMDTLTDDDDDDETDDDDDDEEEEKPKARRGKKAEPEADDDDEDDDDEDEDDDETDDDDDDDEDEDEDEDDDDDDDEEETDDEEEEKDESDENSLEDYELVVTKTSPDDEMFEGQVEKKKTRLYIGEGLDVDWDEVKKGVKVKVTAEQDDDDYIVTNLTVVEEKKKTTKGGKKGGKKK